jgi:hypothetical protein
MFMLRMIGALAIAALAGAPAVSHATPSDSSAVAYRFQGAPNRCEIGCQNPCDCLTIQHLFAGGFVLVPSGTDPLFAGYDVAQFHATVGSGANAILVTGSGRYRVGGEVALVQQLTLDLSFGGAPAEHFDSGLVPLGAAFPVVSIACAVHGFFCYDTVLVIEASPEVVGSPQPHTAPAGIEWTRPNPFRSNLEIGFTVRDPAWFEVAVLDVTGRRVRSLCREEAPAPGERHVAWDGRAADGRPAAAGVYWVRLITPTHEDRRRIVKLGD